MPNDTIRTISLPAIRKTVSLAAYVLAVKTAKAHPDAEFPPASQTWWPTTGREIMGQFREGMMARINQAVPYSQRGIHGR